VIKFHHITGGGRASLGKALANGGHHLIFAADLILQPFTILIVYCIAAMTSSTKYQPVPGRDSFDHPTSSYTQEPPSYQAQANEGLLGAPRTEDDNVPDDFKFGGMVSEATLDIRMQFVRKVYAIL
jgi:hypothetical protein